VQTMETDFVAVAERFLGTPYLWGGKTSLGVDCSGLLQLALAACGTLCPRDTDIQEQALGDAFARPDELEQLRRAGLLVWKGHGGGRGNARACQRPPYGVRCRGDCGSDRPHSHSRQRGHQRAPLDVAVLTLEWYSALAWGPIRDDPSPQSRSRGPQSLRQHPV